MFLQFQSLLDIHTFNVSNDSLIYAAISAVIIIIWRILTRRPSIPRIKFKRIDKMEGKEFEQFLRRLLLAKGYKKVQLTKNTGDFGADLIIGNGRRKIVVQAKRLNRNVGVEAVQEVHTAKTFYEAQEAWVVTNQCFTKAAQQLAESSEVVLVDRSELAQWLGIHR
jgi:restriction system protein